MRIAICGNAAGATEVADTHGFDRLLVRRIGETELMVSDGQCTGNLAFQGFSLSLTAADDAEAQRLFAALGDGGQVCMPLDKTFFASQFGMVMDRFGVSWMVLSMPKG